MLIAALLARLARDQNIAVVCATHDPAVIAFADANLSLAAHG
jgi:ABC-type lipoprotein export system ATPase subunit